MSQICYLCGKPIGERDRDFDHVPPKQFFPSGIRKRFNLSRLITLPTHNACNKGYQSDEDYFLHVVGTIDCSNPVVKEVWRDIVVRARRSESNRFRQMLLNRAVKEAKTSAGILIPNRIAVEYNQSRVNSVVWKIVRGLYCHEFSRILPELQFHFVAMLYGETTGLDPEPFKVLWNIVRNTQERGQYRAVFAYKYVVNHKENNITAWGLLFWDRHLFVAAHHDPACVCERCRNRNGKCRQGDA